MVLPQCELNVGERFHFDLAGGRGLAGWECGRGVGGYLHDFQSQAAGTTEFGDPALGRRPAKEAIGAFSRTPDSCFRLGGTHEPELAVGRDLLDEEPHVEETPLAPVLFAEIFCHGIFQAGEAGRRNRRLVLRVEGWRSNHGAYVCTKEIDMNKEHAKGAADKAKGAVEHVAGKVAGSERLKEKGNIDKAKGELHKAAGDMQDAAKRRARG